MKHVRVALAGLVLALGSGVAVAETVSLTSDQVIATRQSGMALTGSVTEMMKAGIAAGVDVTTYEEPAATLAKWAAAYPALFPDGTQTGLNTKAKAEIWSDRAGFEKANAVFVAASTKLAEAAKSGDKAAFAAAFAEEGKSCGGCHRAFKAR